MTYELECGHCGYLFTLEGSPPRSVKCPVCGGVLTVAIPVAKAPELPATPPPAPHPVSPPAPVPTPPPARAPGRPMPSVPAPGRELAPPWPSVRIWLNTARSAADFARPSYGLCVSLDLLVFSLATDGTRESVVVRFLALLGVALLIPAVIHIACQIACMQTPHTHGGDYTRGSVAMLVMAVIGGGGLFERNAPLAVVLAALLVGVSGALWLHSLVRLGERLPDRVLRDRVTTFISHAVLGAIGYFALIGGAYLAEQNRAGVLVWGWRAGAGLVGFLLLREYSALLRAATQAVDRYAPAVPRR